ncbi:insulin-like growth factor-binding protein complex acid labile subunit [Lingula anatina]|uniref:Insulin-like growth factor-binding protein complex acid labile subunit n=1 Tax=Lingula anatina TaxID=7574 RepID=A0A1S3J0L1_LINAN|nr:insulin-like growth factor-binding protein complex acid labile subunit [Lingula anatina]XP_013403979.1 insulin-like growth factor-binding protein complex acid labile subunit [Lingula anatina]XP_013403980.1 insulin-like growth factor-binding protein complex acid labile subunit [Lingula anatina]XP_013403981.1 insulin-like growth factor-binding protein complex acid labile subunit [Lingula anatina]XP_013403982.1 insulin-like growth factor-binding protein complex acid labile subunit [Lingula anat|eukprot:XP_013403978.1 insulin-like growth factor-binding protein complex acid labile subunit [Lingula anatina]
MPTTTATKRFGKISLWVFIHILVGWVTQSSMTCPTNCVCEKRDTVVRCVNLQLSSIPTLPTSVQRLYLSGNKLQVIQNNSFQNLNQLKYLELENSQLRKLEPNAFKGLDNLQVLKLGHNRLTSLPRDLFDPTRLLLHLDLSFNSFSAVPNDCMHYLTKLKVLNVSYNEITNPTLGPTFQFTKRLQILDFTGNRMERLDGSVFQTMLWWESIPKYLNLSNCNIKYIHADTFEKLYYLVDFNLSGNTGIPTPVLRDALKQMEAASLKRLTLSYMNISAPSEIFSTLQLTGLEYLDLSHNDISSLGLRGFSYLNHLSQLDLSYNLISEVGDMTGLSDLRKLSLAHNLISNLDDTVFEKLQALTDLDLSYNMLREITDGPFEELWELKSLDVTRNYIQRFEISSSLESLEALNLSGNSLTDLGSIPLLSRLNLLDVSHNRLQALRADLFSRSNNLKSVNFSSNIITEVSANTFTSHAPDIIDLSSNKITRLENYGWTHKEIHALMLKNNGIRSISNDAFAGLRWLKVLDLSKNSLQDIHPEVFKDLQNLENLILSDNNLGGMLQSASQAYLFNYLRSLKTLYLDANNILVLNNNLFKNITSLSSLDLSQNSMQNISETLLENLHSLKYLNLSCNNFRTFPVATFKELSSLEELDISHNTFACSCNLLELRSWMETTGVSVASLGKMDAHVCSSPPEWKGRPVMYYRPSPDMCSEVFNTMIIYIIVAAVSVLIILVIIIACVCHRKRRSRRRNCHHHNQYGIVRGSDNTGLQEPMKPLQQQQNGKKDGNVWL